jgi:rod shape-determining protein MreD
MPLVVARRGDWSFGKLLPTLTILVLDFITVLPLRIPDYATVVPLLALGGVYYWTIYRPELAPPTALFLCAIVLDLLDGAPLGLSALVFLLARTTMLPQRRFFVNRLFPFVWLGFTMLAAAAVALLAIIGAILTGAGLDFRASLLQWVLTVACFPATGYLLMRVQRGFVPAE